MKIISCKTDNLLYFAILGFMTIAYGLLSYFTPAQLDDLTFMGKYLEYSGTHDFQWDAIVSFAHNQWLYDNARFANILAPIVDLITPWTYIFPWLTGAMIALILYFSMKIIDIRENKCVLAALLWGAFVVFLPWRNNLFVPDFSLNYIYASAITLGFLYFLIRRESLLRRGWIFFVMLTWAILAGGWHEGFSVPTLAGIAVLIIVRVCQKSFNCKGWRWYVVIAMYLIATIYITFCPGVISRAGIDYLGGDEPGFSLKMLFDVSPTIILTIILGLTIIIGKWSLTLKDALRAALKNDMFIVIVTSSYVSAVISLLFNHTPRTSFYPNLTAIIATIMLLRAPVIMLIEKRLVKWLAAITALLCIVHAVHSIRWQYRFYKEYDILMSQFIDKGKTTVFYDLIMPESVDVFTLYFPAKLNWLQGFQYVHLGEYLRRDNLAVVPTALRNVTMESGEVLSPADEKIQIRRVGDALFTQYIYNVNSEAQIYLNLKMKETDETITVQGFILNFKTENGDSLAYIKPYKVDSSQIKEGRLTSYSTYPIP